MDAARIGQEQARQDTQEGRLASPVGANERRNATGADLEVDAG
jgi:hypothetical protein